MKRAEERLTEATVRMGEQAEGVRGRAQAEAPPITPTPPRSPRARVPETKRDAAGMPYVAASRQKRSELDARMREMAPSSKHRRKESVGESPPGTDEAGGRGSASSQEAPMGQPSTSRNSEDAGDEAAAKRARTTSTSSTGATQGTDEGPGGGPTEGGGQVEAIASRSRNAKAVRWDTWDEDQEKFRKQLNRSQHLEVMEQVRSMLGCSYDLAEVYSPPRVSKRATSMGMKGGFSLDF